MHSSFVALRVAAVFFALACLAHVIRLMASVEIVVAGHAVPLAASLVAMVITAALAGWMWIASRPAKPAA